MVAIFTMLKHINTLSNFSTPKRQLNLSSGSWCWQGCHMPLQEKFIMPGRGGTSCGWMVGVREQIQKGSCPLSERKNDRASKRGCTRHGWGASVAVQSDQAGSHSCSIWFSSLSTTTSPGLSFHSWGHLSLLFLQMTSLCFLSREDLLKCYAQYKERVAMVKFNWSLV